MSKILKKFLLINKKMIPAPGEKWTKDTNWQFTGRPKEQIKHLMRYSVSMVTRETQSKTAVRYHYTY